MQAAPVRPVTQVMAAANRPTALPSVSHALRAMESLLLGGGQRTARRNAWTAVLEDRRRAKDRVEAQHVLEAVSGRTS
ncbi:SCO2195 family GlnR-regulated protein [Streptomyces niveus]|uniref:SCO2195 family GlnR-regulated protein n=1 Tax=Streptomyces niveus TaxID=193462 RepID=UPI003F53F93D